MIHSLFREKFEYLTNYFESALNNKQHSMAQSIIFYGQDMLAQYYLAMEIARLINCSGSKDENCTCLNCNWIRTSKHPAVLTVSKNDNKPSDDTSKKVISIKQIHSINNSLVQSSDYYRVFIFCDSEIEELSESQKKRIEEYRQLDFMLPETDSEKKWFPYPLTREVLQAESANALLKSIEEPPERVLFIFLTRDRDDIIETIVSRSQSFYVPSLPMMDYDINTAKQVLGAYPEIQKTEVLNLSQNLVKIQQEKGYNSDFMLNCIQYYLAELMKSNINNKILVNKIRRDILAVQKAKQELTSYIRPQLIFENMLFSFC